MRFSVRNILMALTLLATVRWPASADELLPPDKSIEDIVDLLIDARLVAESVVPVAPADDVTFVRRVTLDLAGRIPTSQEVLAYRHATEPDKKSRLVDRLISSPDFAYHQRNELDILLMNGRASGEFREWLLKAMQDQRPWSEMFRSMMLARENDAAEKPAAQFLKTRATNVDDLTNDTSRLFLGISISCAKCHDHPLVVDWTQDHYFGLASFFNRTYITKKNYLAERSDGSLKFRTTAGEEKQAQLMFLTGAVVTEPSLADKSDADRKAEEEKQAADQERETAPDPPNFSRRAQLVELALRGNTAGTNPTDSGSFFQRAYVNRTWARLFGQGIVTPLDQLHSENEPSHPELLAWLARDAESHNYDLRRLMRGLVLSRAYGRSSRWESPGGRPAEKLFAVASIRPLTPMQFSLSLSVAASHPVELAQRLEKPEEWVNRRRDLENHSQGFAQQIEIPGDSFQVSVSEALLFSNNVRIEQEYLRDSGDRLIGHLKTLSERPQQIESAFLAVLSRPPEPDELEAATRYLASRDDRPTLALQQIVWSLVTSGEFRFNY